MLSSVLTTTPHSVSQPIVLRPLKPSRGNADRSAIASSRACAVSASMSRPQVIAQAVPLTSANSASSLASSR
jgi:hypothetical protein